MPPTQPWQPPLQWIYCVPGRLLKGLFLSLFPPVPTDTINTQQAPTINLCAFRTATHATPKSTLVPPATCLHACPLALPAHIKPVGIPSPQFFAVSSAAILNSIYISVIRYQELLVRYESANRPYRPVSYCPLARSYGQRTAGTAGTGGATVGGAAGVNKKRKRKKAAASRHRNVPLRPRLLPVEQPRSEG